jgi:NADPH:quinone reductase-like Zn-dependent oxidoreductase
VVDPVGGPLRTDSLRVMAPLGRMLLVGNAEAHRRLENRAVGGRIVLTP